jgi:predicted dehydrogenase
MIASGVNWGAVVDNHHTYTIDPKDGATLLSIAVGHAVDALCYCLGDVVEVSALEEVRRPTFTLLDGGGMPRTVAAARAQIGRGTVLERKVADQIAFVGRLSSGAVATVHFRGGLSRGTNLLWEINGSDGDLQITGASGLVELMELSLRGARQDQETMEPMPIPAEYDLAPDGAAGGYAANLSQAYVRLSHDLRSGATSLPSFDDAVKTHRILDAISKSAKSRRRELV